MPEIAGLDIDNCLRILDFSLPEDESPPALSRDDSSKQATLSNMLAGCDRLIRVGQGATCFYGAYSELSFILRTLEVFQRDPVVSLDQRFLVVSRLFDLPLPLLQENDNSNPTITLPHPDVISTLLDAVFAKEHPMLSFLSEEHIRGVATILTGQQPLSLSDQSLSVFHLTLALGYLFDSTRHGKDKCINILHHATNHFHIGLAMVMPIQVNDFISLQAILCATIFLMSTSRITTAHSLIGTACSLALRLGLHFARSSPSAISTEDRRERTRLLATVMRLDLFASLILDLPAFLHRDSVSLPYIARLASEAEAEQDLRTAAALRQVCLLAIPVSKRTYGSAEPPPDGSLTSVDIKHFEESRNEFQSWKLETSSLLACLGNSKQDRM